MNFNLDCELFTFKLLSLILIKVLKRMSYLGFIVKINLRL